MNEAELLFTEILNCGRQDLYLKKDLTWDKSKSVLASTILKKRFLGEPLQYILGKAEFMGLEFRLTPDVLIPRPETEILVEAALELIRGLKSVNRQINILDMGTGSGCIAISLAKAIAGGHIYAADISSRALAVAEKNARLHGVDIGFLKSDLFDFFKSLAVSCDLIVSNPPYIPSAEILKLALEIQAEPRLSLDGGSDGLDFYRKIIAGSPEYLKDGGFLALEMGFNQKNAIKNIFLKSGIFEIINVIKDYNNIDRVIIAKKKRGNG